MELIIGAAAQQDERYDALDYYRPYSAADLQFPAEDREFRSSSLNAVAIYAVTDVKGRILDVNENFCEISEYSREELIGKNHRILKSGLHSTETFTKMYRTIARGATWRGDLCNRSKSGRLYWVDTTIVPWRNLLGKIIGYSSIRIDVTQQKKAEEALQDSEMLLRSTLAALSEGVVVQDMHGLVISSNPAAERILGVGLEIMSGTSSVEPRWRTIYEDGSDFPISRYPAIAALATGQPQHQVIMGLRKENSPTRWVSVTSQPIFTRGNAKPTSVVTSFSDITQRKQAQEVLAEAINASPDALVIYDENDRLVACNSAYREIYAQSASSIVPGVLFEDVLRCGLENDQYPEAGETSEQRSAWLSERIALHCTASTDVIQHLPNDRWIQLRERRTSSGFIVGFRIDVSELKRSAAKLQAVIDSFPGGISFFDQDYNLAACNEKFRDLFGLPSVMFERGMPALETIIKFKAMPGDYGPGESVERIRERFGLSQEGEANFTEWARSDGAILEIHSTPLGAGGCITTYVDVTARRNAEKMLINSEKRARTQSTALQLTLAHMSQGLSMFDSEDRLAVWNDRYVEIYGIPSNLAKEGVTIARLSEHLAQIGCIDIDEPDWRQKLADRYSFASTLQLRDGRVLRIVRTPVDGGGWVETHDDITEQRHSEMAMFRQATELARTNMRFDAALTNMSQGLCLFDADKNLAIANKRYREMYGFTEDQVKLGTELNQLLLIQAENGETSESPIDTLLEMIPTESRQAVRLADGRTISIQRTPTPDGGWVAIHEDISERESAIQRISHLAYHDVLTGLANRAEFKMRGEAALARATNENGWVGVLLIDLDRFKAINDTLGHAIGDKLLQLVAERMLKNVRSNDVVARLGGDEFAIVQHWEPNQREAAISLATRLIDALGAPYDIDGHQAIIGTSIGIALESGRSSTIEQLMHKADLALYQVKNQGRNAYRIYEDSLGQQVEDRRQLEIDLRDAVSKGALMVHYQPIVLLSDQSVCAMEALVRWKHPTRGMLPPDQFIPLAEETGLIVPLGDFVIRQACLDAAKWPEHIKVAVNISPTHVRRGTLMDTVTRALLKTRLAAERLEIEVTETVLLDSGEETLSVLNQLRSIGVSVALDDFGTGYSSLSHLRMFSFDKVKIDKSFVAEITERSESAAIICAITGLARTLDIVTTAEGVETEDQFRMLKAAGCVQGQGYLFGRPQPASEYLSAAFPEMLSLRSA